MVLGEDKDEFNYSAKIAEQMIKINQKISKMSNSLDQKDD